MFEILLVSQRYRTAKVLTSLYFASIKPDFVVIFESSLVH